MELPIPLVHRLQAGRCVLFVGAGIGAHMVRPDASTMPDGRTLAELIDTQLNMHTDSDDLATVAQIAQQRHGRAALAATVQEALAGFQPDETVVNLTRVPWAAIFTTNYDPGLARAYELNPDAPRIPVVISENSNIGTLDTRFDVPIFYLHGNVFTGHPESILITRDDYAVYQAARRALFTYLRTRLSDSTFVYVGYSNTDPNWTMIQAELRADFGVIPLPHAYRVSPETDRLDQEILTAAGVTTITGRATDFIAALEACTFSSNSTSIPEDKAIPNTLRAAFIETPVPVLRLLNAWEVCNDADFDERPNVSDFLRGDRPNWGIMSRGSAFRRDVSSDLYDFLIDYITRPDPQRYVATLLAPAGYGVSTTLMQICYQLIEDRTTNVFRLRPGAQLLESDIIFVCQTFPEKRNIFVVDDASSAKHAVRAMLRLLGQNKLPACFLLGSRLNEWRVAPGRLLSREFLIEPLSDAEIIACLNLLAEVGELHDLIHFDEQERFALVKSRSNKELLVMLREVTEGRQFDAIIEDEYRRITEQRTGGGPVELDNVGPRLYDLVCALWQAGHYLRDSVAADILETDTSVLFSLIAASLSGVIYHDALNEAEGIYGFRARHRIIALIVWHRCISPGDRERALVNTIKHLNLLYPSDRTAFDALVRSDDLVDSMPSLEARITYFDSAAMSDPRNPYVRQHFARMYLRADLLSSAQTQIDVALSLGPNIRALHHTRGVILSRMSRAERSMVVARKYLAQAEAEFEYCINADVRDDYGYASLAELYREWAERSQDADESAAYLRKAEETVATGLKRTRVHDSLLIESSKIAKALGDKPGSLATLKRAVDSATAGVIARYLYGRALRHDGDFHAAAEVLEPIFLEDPYAFRAAIELALCRVALTGDFLKGAAILSQATLFGYKDATFVATLGGMQFLAKRIDEAKKTFEKGRRLPAEEQRAARFAPRTRIGDLQFGNVRFTGTVSKVGVGFFFVSVPGYLDIFVGTSHLLGKRIVSNQSVSFDVVFSALGPRADVSTLRTS